MQFENLVQVDLPTEMLQQAVQGVEIFQKTLPLKPGRYRLSIAAKDVVGGNQTVYPMALDVPQMEDDKLSASSLILADVLEKVPTKSIGTGQFVIGTSKVRPKLDSTFKKTDKLGIYLQLYNFETDELTKKPEGTVDYEIVKNGSADKLFEYSEPLSKLEGGASEMRIEKRLPLTDFAPGDYTLKIKVTDSKRNQTLNETAAFKVL